MESEPHEKQELTTLDLQHYPNAGDVILRGLRRTTMAGKRDRSGLPVTVEGLAMGGRPHFESVQEEIVRLRKELGPRR